MIIPTPTRYLYDLSDIYPETDGLPMSENTTQQRWIITLLGGLGIQYRDDVNVFVASDLFWYPVEGRPGIRVAPDVLVALGRPKGDRRSYLQWMEDNVPPQIVFEILSPGNSKQEMDDKLDFYQRYGVEEYYLYDLEDNQLSGWQRSGEQLREIAAMSGWISPLSNIRFDMSGPELRVFGADGQLFVPLLELAAQRDQARQEREEAQQQAERERQERERLQRQAERERQERERLQRQAERERQEKEQMQQKAAEAAARAERLAAQLRALGVEPEQ